MNGTDKICESLPLGIVLEKASIEHRWANHRWRPVDVIPGAPALDPAGAWRVLGSGERWTRFHAGTLPLELFRKETEGYRLNLSQEPPRLFVILRSGDDAESENEWVPIHATACPYEAQDYLDSGDDLVEAVEMPPAIVAFVQDFVDRNHVDEPFVKRKRKPHDPRKMGFAEAGRAPVDRPRRGRATRGPEG